MNTKTLKSKLIAWALTLAMLLGVMPIIAPTAVHAADTYEVSFRIASTTSGSGEYEVGANVEIYTDLPLSLSFPPKEQHFVQWKTDDPGVDFADSTANPTTFTMPANDVLLEADFHEVQPANEAAVAADCTTDLVCTCGYVITAGRASHTYATRYYPLSLGSLSHDFQCDNCATRGGAETHTWNSTYVYNDDDHWQKCDVCTETTNYGAHIDNNADGVCDTVGCSHGADVTAPVLSLGMVDRTSSTAATIGFTTDESGTAYYLVLDSGMVAPANTAVKDGTSLGFVTAGAVSGKEVTLTAGAKDIYVVVEDAAGNISAPLKIEAINLDYTINASTLSDFGSLQTPYTQPAAQTVTVVNTGTESVTLTQPTATDYDIGTLSTTTLATNGATATFTVQPKAGLAVGNHDETIIVGGSNGASAMVTATFTVTTKLPHPPGPMVSFVNATHYSIAVSAPNLGLVLEFAYSEINPPSPALTESDWFEMDTHSTDSMGYYTFTGLAPDTEYYFFARIQENEHNTAGPAGPASAGQPFSTLTKTNVSEYITFSPGSAAYTGSELNCAAATIGGTGFTAGDNPVWEYHYNIAKVTGNENAALGTNGKPLTAGIYKVTAAYVDDDNVGLAEGTFTVNKGEQAAPAYAPTIHLTSSALDIFASSVNIDNPGDNMGFQYAYNTVDAAPASGWTETKASVPYTDITGLTPNTTYYIFLRYGENANRNASPASSALVVTTHKAALGGTVTITGTAKFGETLTAVTTGLTSAPLIVDLGALSYQWYYSAGSVPISGATGSTYEITAGDIGQKVFVVVRAANCDSWVSAGVTDTIEKADGLIASNPETISIIVSETSAKTFDLDSIELSKTDGGTRSYSLGALDNTDDILDGSPTLSGTNNATLNYTGAGKTSGTATQVVTITTENYANTTVTVTFAAADAPYEISTAEELAAFATLVNSGNDFSGRTVILLNDIDLDVAPYNTGTGWTPIGGQWTGVEYTRFSGTFDGGEHIISGLFINDSGLYRAGLFGYVDGGTIQNLGVENADITASSFIGGIVGRIENGKVESCYFTGNVEAENGTVGGIAGSVEYSNIINCYTLCVVKAATTNSGGTNAGGIAGSMNGYGSSIENCYSIGTVEGWGRAGGIVGTTLNGCIVTNCAALNESVKVTSSYSDGSAGRVVAYHSGYFEPDHSGNAAWDGMTVIGYLDNGDDGEDITVTQITTDGTLDGRFESPVWQTENGKLPWLFGEAVNLPSYLSDATPPTVTTVTPSGTGAAVSGIVFIQFSKAMDTATTGTVQLNGSALSGGEWSEDKTEYSIPYSGLSYGTAYTVSISGFKDASVAGIVMTPDDSNSFTTANAPLPTGNINIGTDNWETLLHTITFALFSKSIQTVEITTTDNGGGTVTIQYLLATAEMTETELDAATWTTYSAPFNINPNNKQIVYAKLTDPSGNKVYISSNGIVVYTDSAQDTANISFTKGSTADVTANVTLNGNTINTIKNGTATLTEGTHYTVSGETITFTASYLNSLTMGNYTLTVSYNPLGEIFVGGDAPATTTIGLTVISTGVSIYTVTYNGNGNTGGTAPVDSNSPYSADSLVTVLGQGSLLKTGYTFLGWSTNPNAVAPHYTTGYSFYINSSITLYAVWEENIVAPETYSVTYQPGTHGTFTPQVTSGLSIGDATPQAPTVTGEDGWVFAGWSPVPTATVTGNATYVAQWNTTYSVTYQPGTHGTFAPQVTSGLGIGDATPQAPAITGEDGWVFAGWSPVPTATVTGNATYVAQWNIVTPPPLDMCTVTFVDWDGRILKTEQVAHGSSATAPTNPLRSSYTFIGWDKSFDNITSDLTVTALYNGEATPPPPLAEEKDTWALLSLILAITGVLTAIAVSVYVLMRRKLNPMLLAVMALGIVGIIVFLLTQSVGSCGGLLP